MAIAHYRRRRLAAACLALVLVGGQPALADADEAEAQLAARTPSPWIAALLSTLVPGLGQFYAGERQRALIILGGGLALLTGTVLMNQAAAPPAAGTTATQPRAPLDAATLVMNMALPTYWAWNIGDAVRVSLPASGSDVPGSPQASASPPPLPH